MSGKKTGPKPKSIEELFWRSVDLNGPVPLHCPELGPCWIRKGGRRYGGEMILRGKRVLAHRVAWFIHYGQENPLLTLHKCDGGEIGCVRWDHLFAGTHEDNLRDMGNKKRQVFQRHPEKAPIGERHGRAILTDQIVRDVVIPSIEQGRAYAGIARELGVSPTSISRIGKGEGWKNQTRGIQQPSRWVKKLNKGLAREIRARQGEPLSRLAEEYGVSRSAISNVMTGRTFKT